MVTELEAQGLHTCNLCSPFHGMLSIRISIFGIRVPCKLPRFALPAVDVSFEKHAPYTLGLIRYIRYSLSEEGYLYVYFI